MFVDLANSGKEMGRYGRGRTSKLQIVSDTPFMRVGRLYHKSGRLSASHLSSLCMVTRAVDHEQVVQVLYLFWNTAIKIIDFGRHARRHHHRS